MNELVSVIIPVYNPGTALRKCLDSVMTQTYGNIEIIVINDGSTDGSHSICSEYASKDRRIKYISQPNAGVSAARNRGIDSSSGEYICFVDSDDYLEADYVKSMADAIRKSRADIVIQGLNQFRSGVLVDKKEFESSILPVSGLDDAQFDKIFYYCGPYCKLFKASVIKDRNIRFPVDISYGEDAVFYHAYLSHCKVVEFISDCAYNYIVDNQGALSTKSLSPEKFWKNQSNRRGAYRTLRKAFGLPCEFSESENQCKIIGLAGMLNAVFKSGADDLSVRHYLSIITSDENFSLSEIKPDSVTHRIILSMVKSNNRLSRWTLRLIYR